MSLKYKIQTYGWFYALIQSPFDDLVAYPFEKVCHIISWVPTLWRDRDWNGESDIYRILDFKLSKVQKCVQEDPYHISSKGEKVKEIKEARACLKRLLEDDYCSKEQKEHNKKFGKLKMSVGKVTHTRKDGTPLARECIFTPDSPAANKSRDKIWKLKEERQKADVNRFYEILKQNSDGWWT